MANIEPVVPNLLAATQALQNKYAPQSQYAQPSQILQALAALPAPRAATMANTIQPLAAYDMARANRGLAPLGPRQSAAALRALTTGKPATPPRRQGLLHSAISDLRALVGAIPKLPMLAVNELRQLPSLPEQIPEALSADNPIQAIGNIANLPGFRIVPGSFIAGQFGEEGQGLQGLLAHPLFTALDVLPFAQGAAGKTAVVRAAREATAAENAARLAQAEAVTGVPGTARLLRQPRPVQTFLTRRLDEAGQLTPTRLGKLTGGAGEAFYSTTPGRAFYSTFKERAIPRTSSRADAFLRQFQDLDIRTELLPTEYNGIDIRPHLEIRDRDIAIRDMMREAEIDQARGTQLYEMLENPRLPDGTPTTPEKMPGLSDAERAIGRAIVDRQRAMARLTEGEFTGEVTVGGRREVYDLATAKKLSAAQSGLRVAQEFNAARNMLLDPTDVTPERINALLDDLDTRVETGTLSRRVADDLGNAYRAALDEAGWTSTEAGYQRVTRPTPDDLLAALRPLSRRYPTIPRLIDHLQNARWAAARKDLAQFAETRAGNVMVDNLPFDVDGLKAELSRLQARDKAINRTAQYTDEKVARRAAVVERAEQRAVPAKFKPATREAAQSEILSRVKERYAASPDLPRLEDMASQGVYDLLDELPADEIRAIQREADETWQSLRDAGHDPVFFSSATAEQAKRLPYTRVSDVPLTPAQARARGFDITPNVKDVGVALSKSSMDLLQRKVTIGWLDEIEKVYGRSRAQLTDELYERAAGRFRSAPEIPFKTHLNRLINERYAPFDRSAFTPGKTSGAFSVTKRDEVLIPRAMADNIQRLLHPPLPGLTTFFDPIMKVFRTSVLPLAVRWHLYNLIGNTAMVALSDPAAFRYIPEVFRAMRRERLSEGGIGAGRVAHHLQPEGAPPSGMGSMVDPESRAFDSEIRATSPLRDRLVASHNTAAGQTLRRWADTARESRISKIPSAAKRMVERSYGWNQLIDDMGRSVIGISERNRQLAKGVSREMAEAEAVSAIRRVFQSWDEMTPMERSVMRTIVPFYGWSAHILRYAFSYPFDHPIRVAVLGGFARAELADAMTGLPDYIRDMVLVGDKRANGTVKALNVGPFNPFRDLPSNFTLAGFLGNLNPVITGVLESVGVNVQQGGPSLYPETRYDPETGRLVVDPGGNLVSNIIGNISPQTNLFTALIGQNESFNELLKRDPDAAGRQLWSNLGLPVLFRDINVGEELIRAEMARFEDQDNARREALKTGNLGLLDAFPGLAAYGDQIRQLEESGQLDQLRPQEDRGTVLGLPYEPQGKAGRLYALQAAALGG